MVGIETKKYPCRFCATHAENGVRTIAKDLTLATSISDDWALLPPRLAQRDSQRSLGCRPEQAFAWNNQQFLLWPFAHRKSHQRLFARRSGR